MDKNIMNIKNEIINDCNSIENMNKFENETD